MIVSADHKSRSVANRQCCRPPTAATATNLTIGHFITNMFVFVYSHFSVCRLPFAVPPRMLLSRISGKSRFLDREAMRAMAHPQLF